MCNLYVDDMYTTHTGISTDLSNTPWRNNMLEPHKPGNTRSLQHEESEFKNVMIINIMNTKMFLCQSA